MDVKELRDEVQTRMYNGETFSVKEIREIMKKTGKSYVQVISGAKKLKKDMEKAEKQALAEGKEFDREKYISFRMNQ